MSEEEKEDSRDDAKKAALSPEKKPSSQQSFAQSEGNSSDDYVMPHAHPYEIDKGRPSWDTYFMTLAEQVATRTTCLRRAVGAVVVKDRRILSTGYNGVPSGIRHCSETGCLREQLHVPSGQRHELCRGLHAEQNAIIQAARYGIDISGASIYVTAQPCVVCAKMLINAGIKEVIYKDPYPDKLSQELIGESNMKMRVYHDDTHPESNSSKSTSSEPSSK